MPGAIELDGRLFLSEREPPIPHSGQGRMRHGRPDLLRRIHIDKLLAVFGLTRNCLGDEEKVAEAIRAAGHRMPTCIAVEDVRQRWGHGQEAILPAARSEKLTGEMTSLPEIDCGIVEVPRPRGRQLKKISQLDGWRRDGSAEYAASLCRS